jgi:hypothetical protein
MKQYEENARIAAAKAAEAPKPAPATPKAEPTKKEE